MDPVRPWSTLCKVWIGSRICTHLNERCAYEDLAAGEGADDERGAALAVADTVDIGFRLADERGSRRLLEAELTDDRMVGRNSFTGTTLTNLGR